MLTLSATRHSRKIRKALKRLYPAKKTHRERLESFIADATLQRFLADLDKDEEDSSSASEQAAEPREILQTQMEDHQPVEQAMEHPQIFPGEPRANTSGASGANLDQILVFDNNMQPQRHRQRRKYSPQGRQRVNGIRKRGACQACVVKKKRVSQGPR